MAMLSLGQAAKLAGVGKTTISRAIQAGRLSAAGRTPDGGYQIDPAELSRVYEIKLDEKGQPLASKPADDQDENFSAGDKATLRSMMSVLEERIEGLKSTLESERKRADAAEADRDRWAGQAEKIAALLPAPAEPAPQQRSGPFGRLFGRKAS